MSHPPKPKTPSAFSQGWDYAELNPKAWDESPYKEGTFQDEQWQEGFAAKNKKVREEKAKGKQKPS